MRSARSPGLRRTGPRRFPDRTRPGPLPSALRFSRPEHAAVARSARSSPKCRSRQRRPPHNRSFTPKRVRRWAAPRGRLWADPDGRPHQTLTLRGRFRRNERPLLSAFYRPCDALWTTRELYPHRSNAGFPEGNLQVCLKRKQAQTRSLEPGRSGDPIRRSGPATTTACQRPGGCPRWWPSAVLAGGQGGVGSR